MRMKVCALVLCLSVAAMSGVTCPSNCTESDPNPAADRIDFTLVSQTSPTEGRVRIEGVIENKGLAAFDTSAGQQSVQLYEEGELVAIQDFEDLAPGQTVTVTYERDWNTATEFPPVYRVTIGYDPDIFIDNNPLNDDCATADNTQFRDGAQLNDLF